MKEVGKFPVLVYSLTGMTDGLGQVRWTTREDSNLADLQLEKEMKG